MEDGEKLSEEREKLTYFRIESSSLEINSSNIYADRIFLLQNNKNFNINDSFIGNYRGSCALDNNENEQFVPVIDKFVEECRLDDAKSTDCEGVFQNMIKSSISFIIINSKNGDLNLQSSSINQSGTILLNSQNLTLDPKSTLSASESGCPSRQPEPNTSYSKYLKVCKVKGGSNLGRGTLGKDINLEICKFLIPAQIDHNLLTYPTPVNFVIIPGTRRRKKPQIGRRYKTRLWRRNNPTPRVPRGAFGQNRRLRRRFWSG